MFYLNEHLLFLLLLLLTSYHFVEYYLRSSIWFWERIRGSDGSLGLGGGALPLSGSGLSAVPGGDEKGRNKVIPISQMRKLTTQLIRGWFPSLWRSSEVSWPCLLPCVRVGVCFFFKECCNALFSSVQKLRGRKELEVTCVAEPVCAVLYVVSAQPRVTEPERLSVLLRSHSS